MKPCRGNSAPPFLGWQIRTLSGLSFNIPLDPFLGGWSGSPAFAFQKHKLSYQFLGWKTLTFEPIVEREEFWLRWSSQNKNKKTHSKILHNLDTIAPKHVVFSLVEVLATPKRMSKASSPPCFGEDVTFASSHGDRGASARKMVPFVM